MTKSWKKLVKTTDFDSNTASENSFSNIQLTLDELAAQNQELDHLLKERQSLENEMGNLLQSNNPVEENPRFTGTIESFKSKREKEKKRAAQKKKLEERLLKKSKELEKWEENQARLKEKLALQRKSLSKKETEQDPSTSLKAPKSTKNSSEKRWFDTNTIRKKKDVIERVKKVPTEQIKKVKQIPEKIRELKPSFDLFGQKDLVKFQKKLDQEKKTAVIPTQVRKIKDDWDEKREAAKAKLKEKIHLKKLEEKLEETKRFGQSVKAAVNDSIGSLESKDPQIKEMTDKLKKELSMDDRQNNLSENASAKKAEQKEAEQKDTERREKLKERFLSRKKAEQKEEKRSSRKKERKNEKYI
ncbi:hypothetical protein [Fluviicola chungangensis]|uniref:Uncharacterized protein n=1 Tax=Fluviicola chungangensis TaxID=2597671 RepID=A0A556MNX7_9FLAO|nr:hypothetical protein [Fluviicola chungangensis]TSJ41532.1 hypothetical protein FO442_13795 [Fluviicola chungangensis]